MTSSGDMLALLARAADRRDVVRNNWLSSRNSAAARQAAIGDSYGTHSTRRAHCGLGGMLARSRPSMAAITALPGGGRSGHGV
jgi:hypothetical protein